MYLSFLLLWSICWSSSLVHFKNGPGYITRGTAQVFILLMRYSLGSSCFFVLLRYSFLNFFLHLHLFDGVRLQYSQVFAGFFFSEHPDFSWLGSSILLSCAVSRFSLLAWRIFLCHIPSLCLDWIFSLSILWFPILFYFRQIIWYRTLT